MANLIGAKTPVSLLQETVVRCKLPFPDYAFTKVEGSYRCTATIGAVSAVGEATTKQAAKHGSALNLLKQLKVIAEKGEHEEAAAAVEGKPGVFVNHVGQLNEFTAANRLPYPSYNEEGVTAMGQFVIRCTLGDLGHKGVDATKKQAKQKAAHALLKSLKEGSTLRAVKEQISARPLGLIDNKTEADREYSSEEIVKKYQQLTIATKKSNVDAPVIKTEKPSCNGILKAELDSLNDLQGLKEMCCELRLRYQIEVLDNKHNLLLLKEEGTNITELGRGETYEAALTMLLKRYLKIKCAEPFCAFPS